MDRLLTQAHTRCLTCFLSVLGGRRKVQGLAKVGNVENGYFMKLACDVRHHWQGPMMEAHFIYLSLPKPQMASLPWPSSVSFSRALTYSENRELQGLYSFSSSFEIKSF